MPVAVVTRPAKPFLRRALWGLVPLALLPLVLLLLAVETAPRVADPGPPDAAAAARTRDVAERLQAFVASEGAGGSWSAREDEINAVLAAAQRVAPGIHGVARVGAAVTLDLSIGEPLMPRRLWLNLRLAVPPSERGLRLAAARIGKLPVPPGLALHALRRALDARLGEELGSQALASVAAVRLSPPQVTVAFDFDAVGREAFFARLRERALAGAGTTAREQVYAQLWHLDRAVRRGDLPRTGSVLPYLEKAVRVAGRISEGEDREEMRAALYALALYCGDPDFGEQIGVTLKQSLQGMGNGCERTTLAGRDDLKRHFVISAGLYGATASGAAFGVGELKELLDSNEGGSGFSFTDMVADVAGVRFAQALLAAPREQWPAMLAKVGSEADLIPSLAGLPEGLSDAEFRARFRDVDSPGYAAMVAEIERRVDALPLYADRRAEARAPRR
jgi:hypothetical protein